jgi:hypothetical protein
MFAANSRMMAPARQSKASLFGDAATARSTAGRDLEVEILFGQVLEGEFRHRVRLGNSGRRSRPRRAWLPELHTFGALGPPRRHFSYAMAVSSDCSFASRFAQSIVDRNRLRPCSTGSTGVKS